MKWILKLRTYILRDLMMFNVLFYYIYRECSRKETMLKINKHVASDKAVPEDQLFPILINVQHIYWEYQSSHWS